MKRIMLPSNMSIRFDIAYIYDRVIDFVVCSPVIFEPEYGEDIFTVKQRNWDIIKLAWLKILKLPLLTVPVILYNGINEQEIELLMAERGK